jgi:hypothetical protein
MVQDRLGTFMFVPLKSEDIRTIAVTRRGLMAAGGLLSVLLLFLVVVAWTAFQGPAAPAGSERENRELLAEIESLELKLATLSGQMSVLAKRDEELRILADLPRIPIEVQAVGVGGPGHEGTAGLLSADPIVRRLTEAEMDLDRLLRRSRLIARSMGDAEDIVRSKAERWTATPSIWPTDGFLSSAFSYARRHPLLGTFRPHYGVDISARAGNKVVATADGVVTFAGWRSGSGNHVEIDHGYGIETAYSHNAQLLVKKGQRVVRGTPIGLVGSTGLSVAPHVHYEVHQRGQPVDPAKFVFPEVAAD